MNCSIICVGTELLIGQITNTNSVYLSQQLNQIGVNVFYHFSVGDNESRFETLLKEAMDKSDIIITTGGLGPTQDDLTKETIALSIDAPLLRHEPSYEKLCLTFKKLNRSMTENNIKQAYLPKDCIVLDNSCGTAPGFIIEKKGKIIIALPGPPKEMTTMFENHVKEYLKEKTSSIIYSKILRVFGMGESELETVLGDLITEQTNPTLATYAKEGEVSIRVTSKAEGIAEATEKIHCTISKIKDKIGEKIYSYDNEELKEVVAKKLVENKISISLAESCTGGLLASSLTDIPGISNCFDRCLVTYSNSSKIEELGVNPETLDKFGAVSEPTAKEMVVGLKNKTNSDICIAITGIAGPDGGTEDKPVGLVYISMYYKDKVVCNKYNIWGDRNRVRNYSCLLALNLIRTIFENSF